MVRRPLAANAHVLVLRPASIDGHLQEAPDGLVPLVEQRRYPSRVAVQAERELGQVVGADRHAVEKFEVLPGKQGIAGQLAHHDEFQSVHAALKTVRGQQSDHFARLLNRAHEGHHHLDVLQSHVPANLQQRPTLQFKAGFELLVHVAGGAAKAEHGVLLHRFVARAADQVGVLVGLEIRQPHDDRLGSEGSGNTGNAFGQLLHVEGNGVGVTRHLLHDQFPHIRVLPVEFQDGVGVHADHPVDDKFQPGKAHAVIGNGREGKGAIGVAHVHGQPHRNFR